MNAEETLARHAPQIEEALIEALPSGPDTPPDLLEAMRYSLMAGGKRLRPILGLLAAEAWADVEAMLGVSVDPALRRANLLVAGVDLAETTGRVLRVGGLRL